jgi:hypothetical protein
VLLRTENKGNVQVAPFGQINVKKGDKVVYKIDFNNDSPKDNVLPDSARRWTIPIKNIGKFGKYTVVGTFTYGTSSKSVELQKTVWIVPTLYIVLVVGAILVLVIIILLIRLFLKSYKKKILKNAK